MRIFYFFSLLLFGLYSQAQFSAAYAPSNWTTTLSPGSNGSVNTTAAPSSITIIGSDGAQANNIDVDYTITAVASGTFSFSWSYHTNDSDKDPQYDLAGVLVNGVFTQLSANTLNLVDQSGTWSGSVTAGTVIGFRLRAVDNIYGNATFSISSFSPPGNTLPVKLVAFDGKKQNTAVLLNWLSASETGFSHFVVEHSANGIQFNTIQTVKALGSNSSYSITDNNPSSGKNYYRLKMVDQNGTSAYSKAISVDMDNTGIRFSVAPNPTFGQCTLYINTPAAFTETVTITNVAGIVVEKEKIFLQPGSNKKQLNTGGLAKGVYFLSLQTSGTAMQLIKQ